MKKEIAETQRLADINALLDYIKEGIDKVVSKEKEDQLDKMGEVSQSIISVLIDVKEGIESSERNLLELHSEITEETFEKLENPLKSLLDDIKSNTTNQEEFLKGIKESYKSYEQSLINIGTSLKESSESEREAYEAIEEKVDNIAVEVGNIENQIPKEITYQASLKEINNSINRMIESERLNNDRHRDTLDKVAKELTISQELLESTNESLDDIAEIYEKSAGRLHVLDVKLDTLSSIILENVNNKSMGGMDSE